MRVVWLVVLALGVMGGIPGLGEEPAHFSYLPVPPGSVVASQVVYLAGESMHSQWRAVVSKARLGAAFGQTRYQWYLSIYQIGMTTYRLRYQSPRDGGPLSRVIKTAGSPTMWFPVQAASIAGVGALMAPAVEQVVIGSHETGADCGTADVTILTFDEKSAKVVPAVSVQNGCDLGARIVHENNEDAVQLTGPYYAPSAPLCCPTKPKATAMLRYRNGAWVETPKYFRLYPRRFAPA